MTFQPLPADLTPEQLLQLRRNYWLTVPWDRLHAEIAHIRGLRRDYQQELAPLGPDDPGRITLTAGLDYEEANLADALWAVAQAERITAPRPFPWSRADRAAGGIITTIRDRLDLPTVVEESTGLCLNRRGREWTMRCPLPGHDDTSPSFSVSPGKALWHCFGCLRGGDVVSFAQHLWLLPDPLSAARELDRRYPDLAPSGTEGRR